jgi:hypothetical protein
MRIQVGLKGVRNVYVKIQRRENCHLGRRHYFIQIGIKILATPQPNWSGFDDGKR